MSIPGHDQLSVAGFQLAEGVEELLLDALFAIQEIDVVHDQDIHVAEPLAEAGDGAGVEGLGEVVGERFGGKGQHLFAGIVAADLRGNGIEQMRLAVSDSTVEVQRMPVATQNLLDSAPGQHVARTMDEGGEFAPSPSAVRLGLHLLRGASHRARARSRFGRSRRNQHDLLVVSPSHTDVRPQQLVGHPTDDRAVLLLEPPGEVGTAADDR